MPRATPNQAYWRAITQVALIALGAAALLSMTLAVLAVVLGFVDLIPDDPSLRVFLGVFLLGPILIADARLFRHVYQRRQPRGWPTGDGAMPDQIDRFIRRDMESAQTGQKMAGWVLILLGGGVLAGITFAVFANVFSLVEFIPMTVSLRIFLGFFVLVPILAVDFWLLWRVWRYRQSRKWLAEYERDNPLPYRTDED